MALAGALPIIVCSCAPVVPQRLTVFGCARRKSHLANFTAQSPEGGDPAPCAGDMVVEYVGETVRRSVVGLREAAEYDARCGSGTYVFGMSASSGLCTDATRVRAG